MPGDAGIVIPVLSAAYLVNVTTGVGTTLAISYGVPGFAAANSVLIALMNVALTIALAPLFGLWGVISGTAVAVVLGSMVFNVRFLKRFDLRWSDFADGALRPAALAIGLALPFALLSLAVGLPSGRPAAFALLAVCVLGYGLPYWYLASRRRLLPEKLAFRWGRAARPAAPGA